MRNSEGQKSGRYFFLPCNYRTLIFFVVDEDIDYLTSTKRYLHTTTMKEFNKGRIKSLGPAFMMKCDSSLTQLS